LYSDSKENNLTVSFIEYLKIFRNFEQISTSFNIPIKEIEHYLNLEQKNHVFRIVKELITNSLKHSGATELKIEIKFVNERVEVYYFDNGKGITEIQYDHGGVGLLNIEERVELLNGELSIFKNNDQNNINGFNLWINFPFTKGLVHF
jgi:signal transduction histidine kinase